jgi:hypothetical protein
MEVFKICSAGLDDTGHLGPRHSLGTHMGVSIVMGIPQIAGWFIRENPSING